MRWNPPDTLYPYMDEPITVKVGMVLVGVGLMASACSVLILLVALVSTALRVLGWS